MNALKFGAYAAAMVVFPAVFCGAITFAVIDHVVRRRDDARQWSELVNEAQSWLAQIEEEA